MGSSGNPAKRASDEQLARADAMAKRYEERIAVQRQNVQNALDAWKEAEANVAKLLVMLDKARKWGEGFMVGQVFELKDFEEFRALFSEDGQVSDVVSAQAERRSLEGTVGSEGAGSGER